MGGTKNPIETLHTRKKQTQNWLPEKHQGNSGLKTAGKNGGGGDKVKLKAEKYMQGINGRVWGQN